MQNSPLASWTFIAVLTQSLFVFYSCLPQTASAQAFVNGDFENGSFGWEGCLHEIGTAATYGGVGGNNVAEVDGDLSTDPLDDRVLCQTITGFIVGGVYLLEFQATRRDGNFAPDPLSATVSMNNDALYHIVSRSGGYAMIPEAIQFIASSTTHEFQVRPNFEGSYGLVFDDFSIQHLYTLPIELLFFTGEAVNDGVRLDWATASEQNNSHFTVQRSLDGTDFSDLLEIEGAGSSQGLIVYSAFDPSPFPGLAYYRLKQTDLQGDEKSYPMVSVHFGPSDRNALGIFPNPSNNGQLWLAANCLVEETTVPVSVHDLQGRLIHRMVITMAPGMAIDLAQYVELNEGMYVVSMPIAGNQLGIRVVVE